VQPAIAEVYNHGVLHVLALLLGLVIGHEIPPLFELVVPPVVLKDVVPDARRQRR
jgi:hypothetical protein